MGEGSGASISNQRWGTAAAQRSQGVIVVEEEEEEEEYQEARRSRKGRSMYVDWV
jgi:hypothetical protein